MPMTSDKNSGSHFPIRSLPKSHREEKQKPVFSRPLKIWNADAEAVATMEIRNPQYAIAHFHVTGCEGKEQVLLKVKKSFQLNLKAFQGGTLPDDLTIDVPLQLSESAYTTGNFRQLNFSLAKCLCSPKEVKGKIILDPEWYMPHWYRDRISKERMRRAIRHSIAAEHKEPGDRTIYKHNNATKPFQGGRVSPR